jgi:hypothetical protein
VERPPGSLSTTRLDEGARDLIGTPFLYTMKLSTPAMEFTLKVNVLPPFAVTEENVGAAGKVIVKVVDTVSETLLNLA